MQIANGTEDRNCYHADDGDSGSGWRWAGSWPKGDGTRAWPFTTRRGVVLIAPTSRRPCVGSGPDVAFYAGRANQDRRNGTGYACLHTALDDHCRLAYTEDLPDERAATCAAFLRRATAWFASQGVTVERVLTDNAWAYTKNTWRDTCHDLGISPRWTRPWRPQTNGKVERFHRTLHDQ